MRLSPRLPAKLPRNPRTGTARETWCRKATGPRFLRDDTPPRRTPRPPLQIPNRVNYLSGRDAVQIVPCRSQARVSQLLLDQVASQRSLLTAETLYVEFGTRAPPSSALDFSPVVVAYSKALEQVLRQKIFVEFRASDWAPKFRDCQAGSAPQQRASKTLRVFLQDGSGKLTLGPMSHCLSDLGCVKDLAHSNSFARFLNERLRDYRGFCDRIPRRLKSFLHTYRNAAAHDDPMSRQDCERARSFLLGPPDRLLVDLIEQLANETVQESLRAIFRNMKPIPWPPPTEDT